MAKVYYRKDYQQPNYFITTVHLRFELHPTETKVISTLSITRNSNSSTPNAPLSLDRHKNVQLIDNTLKINGKILNNDQYQLDEEELQIPSEHLPSSSDFTLENQVLINPSQDTGLEGLYESKGNLYTQCEPHGFRRITFFIDRPDVMAKYTVHIIGDKENYPILLSNGNKVEEGELDDKKHFAVFVDPWPKPSYLFALVAGKLEFVEDIFIRKDKQAVNVRVYVRGSDINKTSHALKSIVNSMKWDEEVFGRIYDLNSFNIVAVDDFNFGAMENKSLNLFNSKYVLINPEISTDREFNLSEGVIGHEYFHNWSGNRVTCRDWFQLSLKEGFTVFRDQEFSSDMKSRAVKRIEDVLFLRSYQFSEDDGPIAHPIRPDSYIEVNNFYTTTVYEKGAEIIRMEKLLLGEEGFRKGTDLYFDRHDGQAVTCDDWLQALQDANPSVDLSQFKLWYSQAGTPEINVSIKYHHENEENQEKNGSLELILSQFIPATPGQPEKLPMHIPVAIGIIKPDGSDVIFDDNQSNTKIIHLIDRSNSFKFSNVPKGSKVSVLRGFSAPVKVKYEEERSFEDFSFFIKYDRDPVNRWDAANSLTEKIITNLAKEFIVNGKIISEVPDHLIKAFEKVLEDNGEDNSLRYLILTLPTEKYIVENYQLDPDAVHNAYSYLEKSIAIQLKDKLRLIVDQFKPTKESSLMVNNEAQGKRGLRNIALHYLSKLQEKEIIDILKEQILHGFSMTDSLASLESLIGLEEIDSSDVINSFYEKWKEEFLVVNKWFQIQAKTPRSNTLEIVKKLKEHSGFNIHNPNNVYALFGQFGNNQVAFHKIDGSGYQFLTDAILEIDSSNPHNSARIVSAFLGYKKLDDVRKNLIEKELKRLLASPLSKNVFELVSKAIEN